MVWKYSNEYICDLQNENEIQLNKPVFEMTWKGM